MRTYVGLLLFENLFDDIPTANPDVKNLANTIFTPNLMIVENFCNTTLGKFETVNYEAEGLVELATRLPISRTRIEQLLSQGIYEIATLHTSCCISKDGVCAECYHATFQDTPKPQINDRVVVLPEYLVNSEILGITAGVTEYFMVTDGTTFTKTYAYMDGTLLNEGTDYTLSNNVFTLTSTPTVNGFIVVHCKRQDTAPFLVWLANTYAGSLFGMKPLPSQPLPIRSLLLASILTENRLQLISDYILSVDAVPSLYSDYTEQIRDPLEKGLFLIALYTLYSNVTS